MNHNTIEPGTKLGFGFDPAALAWIKNMLNMRNKSVNVYVILKTSHWNHRCNFQQIKLSNTSL